MLREGDQIGSYVVEECLAQGGMAEVFCARDVRSGERVALKRALPPALALPRARELLSREARIARALRHPNIMRTMDALEDKEGTPILVMELLEGSSCVQVGPRLRKSVDFVWIAIDVAWAAAQALDYLHRAVDPETGAPGLIHRDVSPDNVFVTREGAVKLIDFGLAKHSGDDRLTRTGMLKGKAAFMSPEQLEGARLDARTDQYSLATTLYWLLCGVCPFERENVAKTFDAIISDPLLPARSLEPRVPTALDAILTRALQRDRDRRYASCAELAAALVAVVPKGARATRTNSELVKIVDSLYGERQATMVISREELQKRGGMKGLLNPLTSDERTLIDPRPIAVSSDELAGASPVPRPQQSFQLFTPPHAQQAPAPLWPEIIRQPTLKSLVFENRHSMRVGVIAGLSFLIVASSVFFALKLRKKGAAGDDDLPPGGADIAAVVSASAAAASAASAASDGPPKSAGGAPAASTAASASAAAASAGASAATPGTRRVRLVAPAHIQWSAYGEPLGDGKLEVEVPAALDQVTALDPRRTISITLPIADVIDYAALPRVPLQIRVRPWAEVTLGKERLGLTPLKPIMVLPGRYKIELAHDGQTQVHEIDVDKDTPEQRYRFD